MTNRVLRIFPSRTNATPVDDLVRVREMPSLFDMQQPAFDEVHISVAFTWDKPWAEEAARQWERVAPVKVGGPAYNEPGSDFVPGLYMKQGYVITSRGCPNRCWFCSVPKREGGVLRELPIVDGHIITDDNLLACSEGHIAAVFEMLKRQPERPTFTGGLEAALLSPQMALRLKGLKPKSIYFAYDTPNDLEPLHVAGKMLIDAGFTKASNVMGCYILCGYKGDTFDKAEQRMGEAWKAGFMPRAMLYREETGARNEEWVTFKNIWSRRQSIYCRCLQKFGK